MNVPIKASLNRRRLLSGAAGFFAVSTVPAAAFAATPPASSAAVADPHAHHHGVSTAYPPLAATAADCIKTGQVCIDHCLKLMAEGDKSLAGCARSVQQMLPVCAALQQLAVQRSPHLAAYARVAAQICRDCEKECRKHEGHHAACKDCAEACAACAKECESLAV